MKKDILVKKIVYSISLVLWPFVRNIQKQQITVGFNKMDLGGQPVLMFS